MISAKFCLINLLVLFTLNAQAKMFQHRSRVISIDRNYSYNTPWIKIRKTEKAGIVELVELLKKSKTGAFIFSKAVKMAGQQGMTISEILKVGSGSLTDTTLVRKFSPSRPHHITYESKSWIYINRNLSVVDAVLDLAHELTHFSYRTPFNPYLGDFSLKDFMTSTVEGRGGEVDAYLIECRVQSELFPKINSGRSNCAKVTDPATGKLSKKLGVKEFYRIGSYHAVFQQKMMRYKVKENELPFITATRPNFISSAYGTPYPVAAIAEYESIMSRACENDWKRLSIVKKSFAGMRGRSPASVKKDNDLFSRMTASYQDRCEYFKSQI